MMTPDAKPLPLQSTTRTATILTFGATPYVALPTVPATCVPWPWQSFESLSPNTDMPCTTRPPKSLCPAYTPLSSTYASTVPTVLPGLSPYSVVVKVPSTGRSRESTRSSPQLGDAAACAVAVAACSVTGWSYSTYATSACARANASASSDRRPATAENRPAGAGPSPRACAIVATACRSARKEGCDASALRPRSSAASASAFSAAPADLNTTMKAWSWSAAPPATAPSPPPSSPPPPTSAPRSPSASTRRLNRRRRHGAPRS
mmetsp:Transcript_9034/g.31912  ORF Transcript_9034/g.31912 Transcript_9034/m.31912 type:complete len:263 (-) Transcript_9034:249-1037(-)